MTSAGGDNKVKNAAHGKYGDLDQNNDEVKKTIYYWDASHKSVECGRLLFSDWIFVKSLSAAE